MFDIKIFNGLDLEERLKTMVQMLEGLVGGDEKILQKFVNV